MKDLQHGTKEENICSSCIENKNNCPVMLSLMRNDNYLKKCGGYKKGK